MVPIVMNEMVHMVQERKSITPEKHTPSDVANSNFNDSAGGPADREYFADSTAEPP